jgi:ferredoxin
LGVGAYLGLVNQGLEQLIVRLDACTHCPWGKLRSQIEIQVEQAQHILAAWNLADALMYNTVPETTAGLKKRPFWNASSPPMSRRDLFRWHKIEKQTQSQKEENIGKNNPNRERLRILQAFKKLPPPKSDEALLKDLGFALIAVNDQCTACGVCARACPTSALQMVTDNTSFQLLFTPQACIGCHICHHVCTPHALTIRYASRYNQVFSSDADQIVQQGALTHCAKCNTPFAGGTTLRLCPVCEFRQQNRFGSATPPGMSAILTKKEHPD